MKLSDFDFDLPDDLIATRPATPRTSARLLHAEGGIRDAHVFDLPNILRPGDLLVLNNTKVIPARLTGQRARESAQGPVTAKIEVTLLSPTPTGDWTALIKPLRKVAEGEQISFDAGLVAMLIAKQDGQGVLSFNLSGGAFDTALAAAGAMPLPPYIEAKRKADAQDRVDYQTVFAKEQGAVAAPPASLHFDQDLLADIFITPGYQFRVTQGLMTNFHLPKSTLMMLVSALMGAERVRDIYAHAIAKRYRFFSYGDSSLLIP